MKFTAKHLTFLATIIFIGFFSIAGYDLHVKNRPEIIPTETVENIVQEIFQKDSVINIPIEISYEYKDINFESNGDTTYWFFIADGRLNNGTKSQNSRVIMFPYSHFNFIGAAEEIAKENTKSIFIKYFQQISKASYLSYKPYSNKY
jgi:hypothetical protein